MLTNSEDGFTLIEVIMAGVVASIIIMALYGAFTGIEQINKDTNDMTTATAAAQQLIEQYRNTPFANITTGTTDYTSAVLANDTNLATPRDASVTVTSINTDVVQVDATVSWKSLEGTRKVELTTQISNQGLNH